MDTWLKLVWNALQPWFQPMVLLGIIGLFLKLRGNAGRGQIDKLTRRVDKLARRVDAIWVFVFGRSSSFLEAKSPVSLTRAGEEVAEEMGAQAWADSAAKTLTKEAGNKEEHELHDMALAFVEDNLESPMAQKLRKIAYARGAQEPEMRLVLAVVLRDTLIRLLAGRVAP